MMTKGAKASTEALMRQAFQILNLIAFLILPSTNIEKSFLSTVSTKTAATRFCKFVLFALERRLKRRTKNAQRHRQLSCHGMVNCWQID
jgi:hypothetical protein